MAQSRNIPSSPVITLALVLSLAACEPGEVTLVGPDDAGEGETVLDVHVTLGDAALAEDLGWKAGVPGAPARWAYVHHRRYLFQDVVSDDSGVIRFEPEGSGWHWIAAEKEVEIDGERRVLGGGAKTTGSTDAQLSLRLDDPGTLVISEVYMEQPPPWETGGRGYNGSKYIELYNNSSMVLYLDGVLLGLAYYFSRDASQNGHHSCSFTKPFREDSATVWSRRHWRIPGNGAEHPIASGEAVVVAVNAVDHTEVHPSMLDLSGAAFEFGGAAAADNPAAANLEDLSTRSLQSDFLGGYWFVSSPVDVTALPIMTDDDYLSGAPQDFRGFPADAVLDVVVMQVDWTSSPVISRDLPPCEHPIHPRFDAMPGGYLYGSARAEDLLVSSQRRVVRTRGGQPILLDTNTSAVDFENVARTPGWIPE